MSGNAGDPKEAGTNPEFCSNITPPALHLLDLDSTQDRFLFSTSARHSLHPVAGASATNHVLLLSVPEQVTQRTPIQLLLIGPSPGEPTVIMELSADEFVTSALACEDDRVLMSIDNKGQTEVHMWQPTGATRRLLRTDKRLGLLSCR